MDVERMKKYISYKQNEQNVRNEESKLKSVWSIKHYIEKLVELFGKENIYTGERDGSLEIKDFKDITKEIKLRNQIYNSDITIILVSPNMKEIEIEENEQWMPLEINFSLKKSPSSKNSRPNAMLAVVLPDRDNKYNYFMNYCSHCKITSLELKILFKIMNENMFNLKNRTIDTCMECKKTIYSGEDISYISCTKWDYFIKNPTKYIHHALRIRNNIGNYNITLNI